MKTIKAILCAAFFAASFALAGRCDWSEQVVCSMPQEAYEQIYLELGDGCSDYEIARKYMDNRGYYDSLAE